MSMNDSNLSAVEFLIKCLGYDRSSNLVYFNDILRGMFSFHTEKVLTELEPFAVYSVDGKPFVLFFEQSNQSVIKELNKKIWNAQIPVAFFCTETSVEIYNGTSLNLDKFLLNKVHEQSLMDCSEYSPFSYWQITDPIFWANYSEQYNSTTLNEFLLQNIESITRQLKEKYNIPFATKLILRLIFIRFLVDRGVDLGYNNFSSNVQQSQAELLSIVQSKEDLYSLFIHLKGKFNGNLFDLDTEIEDIHLTLEVFQLLYRFLSGTERLDDGQLSLFMMYDFNIIPVELISNIYEIMLGKEAQKLDKAFYTPHYLVDYILKQSIIPYLTTHNSFTVLDPACGSGIFLVECYRKLIEANLNKNNNLIDDKTLENLLVNNIYGVDLNEDAIDITIFSLYLTLLDYKDPKTLVKFKLPNLKDKNLFYSDFFEDKNLISLRDISFDFIIGNPPWGKVPKGKHVDYCKQKSKPQQNDEISRSFIYKVEEYCDAYTLCCLVLPSKLLYNKESGAEQFRKLLLCNAEIQKIIELSSVRKLVFKNAKAPAVIVMFKYKNANNLKNRITYISLKPNIFFQLFHILVIEKNDIKYVEQLLLKENDWAWKTLIYGTSWDFEIIKKLKNDYSTLLATIKKQLPKLVYGAGIETQDGDRNDARHLIGKPLLDSSEGIDHFYINKEKSTIFEKAEIHRPRRKELFDPPYCLVQTGVNCSNYKMRAAYSEETFLSKKTMYIIRGVREQSIFLLSLTGLFNSSFYAYLNFMLGSSIGIEREQRLMGEVMGFPFPNNKMQEISKLTLSIQEAKQQIFNQDFEVEEKIQKLDQLVLDAFNLQNNPFVDYALSIMIPQIANAEQPERFEYQEVSVEDLNKYGLCFLDYFQKIYSSEEKYIKIMIYPKLANRFAAFELFICDEPPAQMISITSDSGGTKEFLSKLSIYQYNDLFYQIRDILYFEDSSFFIIKTNEHKNWHPAIAQIDLAEVIDHMLSDNGGGQ